MVIKIKIYNYLQKKKLAIAGNINDKIPALRLNQTNLC